MFSGRVASINCPRVAVLGTDCAIGKRTTANILTRALNDSGVKAVMVCTGQTGLIQGARHGLSLDAVPDDRGGRRMVVRPDTYPEANLFTAGRGGAGARNELVGEWDGALGSGTSGWVAPDADDAGNAFRSYDWWG